MSQILLLTLGGFAIIILDLFVIPGSFLIAVGLGMIGYGVWLNFEAYGFLPAFLHAAVSVAALPFMVVASLKRLSLKQEMRKEDGYLGVEDRSRYLGLEGIARCNLRPSGSIQINIQGEDVFLDCIAEGGWLEKGSAVVVTEDRGTSLVVRSLGAGKK